MDSRPHVLSLIPLPAMTREALAQRYQLHMAARGPADLVDAFVPLDRIVAVVTNGTTGLSAEWIQQLPALRVVSAFGVGHENVDVPAAHARHPSRRATAPTKSGYHRVRQRPMRIWAGRPAPAMPRPSPKNHVDRGSS